MKTSVVAAVAVAVVAMCASHPSHAPHTHDGPQQTSYQSRQFMAEGAVCSRLLRRTRTRTVTVPVLYNTRTRATQPVPEQLATLHPREVEQMERDGWEVRTKTLKFSQPVYIRVRVCCPWDHACLAESQSAEDNSPTTEQQCANGGTVLFEDGKMVCDCPTGFRGTLCQIAMNTQSPSPRGQPVRVSAPTPQVIIDLIRRADLMRQKLRGSSPMLDQRQHLIHAMAAPHEPATQEDETPGKPTKTPMLDQRQHLINAMTGPFGKMAAVWQQKMMQQRIRQLCRLKEMMQARRQQIEVLRQMQAQGPYSQNINPRYTVSPAVMMALMERQIANQITRDPRGPTYAAAGPAYSPRGPAYTPRGPAYTPRGPAFVARGPAFTHRGPAFVARGPAYTAMARTPYDLDPFNQQPSLVSDPRTRLNMNRERTMMALAFYEYMKGQQGRAAAPPTQTAATPIQRMGGYPGPVAPPPVRRNQFVPMQNPALERPTQNVPAVATPLEPRDPISTNVVQQISYQGMPMQMPNQMPNQVPSEMPAEVPSQMPNEIPNQVPSQIPNQGPSQIPNQRPTMPQAPNQIPQMPNMPNAPNMPQMPQGPDMQGRPQMPTEEQIKKMQKCKPQLEEGINGCLADPDFGGLTIEKFMNTDYMDLAKKVCESSERVGSCFMRQDSACGDSETELARGMIASVMQMMGMVCQQIMSGAVPPAATLEAHPDLEAPPAPGSPPTGLPYKGSTLLPALAPTHAHTPMHNTQDTDIPALPPTEDPERPQFTSTKSDKLSPPTDPTARPEAVHTQPEPSPVLGHDEALPVQHRNLIFGHPAWLVIALGVVLCLVFILSILVCCLCVRRRKQKSMMVKEIERLPVPVDGKRLSIIGVPPPLYTTTTVNQTMDKDDLSLPPIDLDYDTDAEDQKPPLDTEDDADDESDEKTEGSPVAPPREKKGGKK